MGYFPETVAAKLAGRTVGASLLVFMDFRETPRRWWMGFGDLDAGGHVWQGIGTWISIEGLQAPIGTTAPKTTFTLSGVDATVIQMARQASDRVRDRRVRVYVQFFDVTGEQDWQRLDDPFSIWTGRMDQLKYIADGPGRRTVQLTAESLWVNRKRPAYGLYTDSDQKNRFPGDRGMEQVADLVNKQSRWPLA